MIAMFRKPGLVFLTAMSVVLIAGCNDTLRQFITPVPKPTGDPGALSHAVVLSTQATTGSNGSTLHIDVSGDTLAGQLATGPNPIFLGKAAGRVFVINSNNTITAYTALSPQTGNPNTITLSSSTISPIAGGVGNTGDFFTTNLGSASISQISSGANAQIASIGVGTNPVAVAGNSANSKIYVVNNGSNNVTVVSTTDNSVVKTIAVGNQPIWAVMSTDGVFVFVVNQGDGTVMVIDTTLDIVLPCNGPATTCNPTTGAINVGLTQASTPTASPNFAFYDPKLQRLYVTNTGENSVAIIKADGLNAGSGVFAQLLKTVPVSGTPVSVAALSDGSKAYAALGNCAPGTNQTNLVLPNTTSGKLAGCNGNSVSVIDAVGLQEEKTIPVGSGAVSVDVASDASRVFAVAAHDGKVSIIRTTSDTVTTTFPAPQQDAACTSSCPVQIPFIVRVFP